MDPTPAETAALLKSADFISLVANLLEGLGQDRSGVWALADLLQERGFTKAAKTLQGRVEGEITDWTISGLNSREELPKGHRHRRVYLELTAIGTVLKPLWADDEDDGNYPVKKRQV